MAVATKPLPGPSEQDQLRSQLKREMIFPLIPLAPRA